MPAERPTALASPPAPSRPARPPVLPSYRRLHRHHRPGVRHLLHLFFPFTVTREETTTIYTGPTVILRRLGRHPEGRLLEDGNPLTPIAGRTLILSWVRRPAPRRRTPVRDSPLPLIFTGPLGPEPLAATLRRRRLLPAVLRHQPAVVFAFPGRGAFTLGNMTVASAGPHHP